MRLAYAGVGRTMWSYTKQMAALGLVYSGSECVISKARGTHDLWNSGVSRIAIYDSWRR